MKQYIILIILCAIIYIYYTNYLENYEENTYEIPKIIWSYWDSINTIPETVSEIINNRNRILYDWKPILLTEETIDKYINKDDYPTNYNGLAHCHKADWIRLYLLKHYGGVWLDVSIIINSRDKFNKNYEDSIKNKSQTTAYYLNNVPLDFVENWYIMAPKNSYIINKWYNEFTYAIEIGFTNYKTELMQKGIRVSQIYAYGPDDTYLTMHAAMQKLIQSNEINTNDLLLYNACESMYKLHCDCKWEKDCLISKISDNNYLNNLDFIKIRSGERIFLTKK